MLENALSSVVTVAVYKDDFAKKQLGSRGPVVPEEIYAKALDMADALGSGSGFIISRNGQKYIVTNAHVIESASSEPGSIYVFSVNQNKYEVSVLGGDSFYDIAILKFVDTPGNELVISDFKKDKPRIGERVYAIGNPLGDYPYTVTDGIISALNRVRDGNTGKFGFLQTTATVIWGNSGGPLVDENGAVAGINSQIAFAPAPDGSYIWQSQINFALEAELANRLCNDIINNNGRVKRVFLGLEVAERYVYHNTKEGYHLDKQDDGPILTGVMPESLAYSRLSAFVGKQIYAVNGKKVRSIDEVLGEFETSKVGSEITFTLGQSGSTTDVSFTPGQLKTNELNIIAKYVIDKNTDFTADFNAQNVTLTPAIKNNVYQYYEKQYKGGGMNSKEKYIVVAGGLYEDSTMDIWKIEDYNDLGAVLKLSGMNGVFDFFVVPVGGGLDDIEIYRQYLSGNEQVLQKTLWY